MSKKPKPVAIKPDAERAIEKRVDVASLPAEAFAHDFVTVEPVTEPRVTFDDLLAAYRLGMSFEVCAVAPFEGLHVGAGVSVGKEPRTFPIAQLFSLDRSYTDMLVNDERVTIRIVE